MGESAFILRDLPDAAWRFAAQLETLPGIAEAVASYDTVAIYFRSSENDLDWDAIERACGQIPLDSETVHHTIPTCYDLGEDLGEVATSLRLSVSDVSDLHANRTYECAAIGFCPGFPYLRGLPDELIGVPRRPSPRPRVEPGSVGLTGAQTGIYPLERPGGWALIGRTPLTIVDPDSNYFPIRAGHTISFDPISQCEFDRLRGDRL